MLHQHDTAMKYLLSWTCLLCIRESSIISTMFPVPAEAITMCWTEDWHKSFVPNNIQTLAAVIWKMEFISHLVCSKCFDFIVADFQTAEKQRAVLKWKIPSSLLFHHSCFYNQDVWRVWSWQLEAPGPSTKAKMFNAAVWKRCCEKICTMENVFLMCFCERLSACHVYLRCFPAPQKMPFLHFAIGVKQADSLHSESEHIGFLVEFSPKQNDFVIVSNMEPKT